MRLLLGFILGALLMTAGPVLAAESLPWSIETRYYTIADEQPRSGGRSSGTLTADAPRAMVGSQTEGFNDLRITLERRGVGIAVIVDITREGGT